MNTHEHGQTPKWLTIDQAYLLCQEHELPRTKKTIRQWCRQNHVTGQKQTTRNGERWVLDEASLLVKIEAEKQMQASMTQVQTGSNPSEPLAGNTFHNGQSEPVQTGADQFEQVRTSADPSEPVLSEQISELESKVRSLEIDKAVRDKHVEFLSKQNDEGQKNLLSQSRYIGHLETQVLQLGGKPDAKFLQPPTAQSEPDIETPNPSQRPFNSMNSQADVVK